MNTNAVPRTEKQVTALEAGADEKGLGIVKAPKVGAEESSLRTLAVLEPDADEHRLQILTALKAVADEKRLRILAILTGGERCVCEIKDALALSQSLLSFHLRTLKEAGLVTDRRQGRWVYYALDRTALREVETFLGALRTAEEQPAAGDPRCATP